ncbi:hypothetical protein AB5I41_13670 [Sphingomonas sp. MMS24-JH45]
MLETEFPGYDKDKSGALSNAEFASWMDAPSKTKSDPAAKPDAKWNEAAFKQADKDASKSVTKEELASFLILRRRRVVRPAASPRRAAAGAIRRPFRMASTSAPSPAGSPVLRARR